MTDHLAVLEERLASLESALKHAGTLAPDDYGYRFVARCRKEAEALRAAIALMRGQSEPKCPECQATVLFECVACSHNNYPPKDTADEQ